MSNLNQVVSVEKTIQSSVQSKISKLHHLNQKMDLFIGFNRTYQSRDDEGEQYSPEYKKVQHVVDEQLDAFSSEITKLFNVTATRDWANCNAKANIVVDGQTLIENAPTSYLLFLEKQLIPIRTYITELPELDPAERWNKDTNSELYFSEPISTQRTKKTMRPIVLAEATKEHPAQTQLITEDVVIGNWKTVKFSGCIPSPRKKKLLDRVEKLICAVKSARQEANGVKADNVEVGKPLFDYLLSK
jgi:hypothetical protein